VFRGTGTVPNSVIQNFELDASDQEVPPFEFNLAKAKEEMAASKFAKGFSVSLQYPAGSDYFKQMALLIEQELGAIGVNVKLEELESSAVSEKWFEGEFQMTFPFVGTSSDVPVPDEYASFYALPAAELDAFKSFWTNKKAPGLIESSEASSPPGRSSPPVRGACRAPSGSRRRRWAGRSPPRRTSSRAEGSAPSARPRRLSS